MVPEPDPQAAPAAETVPIASTWRHLVAPVPADEMTNPVVEALLATERLVVVAPLAKRLVVEATVEKSEVVVALVATREVVLKAVVVALVPVAFTKVKFWRVVEPERERLVKASTVPVADE